MLGFVFSSGKVIAARKKNAGGGGITTPTFVAAGAGSETLSGGADLVPTYGTNIAGDLFVCAAVGYLSTVTTPSGWTLRAGPNTQNSANNYLYTRDARSSGGESGSVNFPVVDRGNARIYTFRNVATSSFIESLQTAFGANSVANPTITPTGAGRLGCLAWMGYSTGPASVTPGGTPSGGTWAEVAEYLGSTDIFYQELQTADLSGGGAISGGTTAAGGTNIMFCHGFALVGV